MIVPTHKTWTDTEVVTAQDLNTELRDAFLFFHSQPYVYAEATTTQNAPADTLVRVNFDTMSGNDDMWIASEPDIFTVNTPGVYMMGITGVFHGGYDPARIRLQIASENYAGGVAGDLAGSETSPNSGAYGSHGCSASRLLALDAGTRIYFTFRPYGDQVNMQTQNGVSTTAYMFRIGDYPA